MVKLVVKNSGKQGSGVFAGRNIKKGEFIIEFKGDLLKTKETNDYMACLQIDTDLWIAESNKADDYINHSCNPNTGFNKGVKLFALKDIAKGKEICWDYSTSIDLAGWSMNCNCNSQNCRKVIKSYGKLDKKTKLRLKSITLPFLIKKYDI